MHPFSFGERLDALHTAELDQFRATQSCLVDRIQVVTLWVPPFYYASIIQRTNVAYIKITLQVCYKRLIRLGVDCHIALVFVMHTMAA